MYSLGNPWKTPKTVFERYGKKHNQDPKLHLTWAIWQVVAVLFFFRDWLIVCIFLVLKCRAITAPILFRDAFSGSSLCRHFCTFLDTSGTAGTPLRWPLTPQSINSTVQLTKARFLNWIFHEIEAKGVIWSRIQALYIKFSRIEVLR